MLAIILIIANKCHTTESPDSSNIKKKSLQFNIDNLNNLIEPFQGALISLNYHIDKTLSFRIGMNAAFHNEDYEQEEQSSTINTNSSKSFSISAQFLNYKISNSKISHYYGIGPTFIYGYSESKKNYPEGNSMKYQKDISRTFVCGALASYGLEWHFRKEMSVFAEYGAELECEFYEQETKNEYNEDYSQNNKTTHPLKKTNWDFKSSGAVLGLSIYF